jgi:sugar/nucleoside kinase (ribokinase family)
MSTLLVIGALALDRPIWLDGPLRSGGRLRARTLDGALEGRLGGGAANSGCALLAAGHEVLAASVLADDADGLRARALAAAAGLDVRLVVSRPGTSPRTLVLLDPAGERTIIGLDGSRPIPQPKLAPPSGYPPLGPDGVFVRTAYDGAADWARMTAGPVILHWPAPTYEGEADVVVVSAEDLPEQLARSPFPAAAARLGPRLGWVVVTHGRDGAVAHGRNSVRIEARPAPANMRDATGAGDVFAAGLLDALVASAGMGNALRHACAWGAAAAELDGSAPVDAPPGTFRAWSGQALAQLS